MCLATIFEAVKTFLQSLFGLLMLTTVLFANVGFTITEHFCSMEKTASMSCNAKEMDNCCCKKSEDDSKLSIKCCEEETTLFKIAIEPFTNKEEKQKPFSFEIPLISCFNQLTPAIPFSQFNFVRDHSPPSKNSAQSLFCTYRC